MTTGTVGDLTLLDEVRWGDMPLPGERLHALVASLAEDPHRPVVDQRLVEEVWRDAPPASPTKALQVLVSRARAQTHPDAVVRNGHGYRLGAVAVDAATLRERAAAAAEALAAGDGPRARDLARAALDTPVVAPHPGDDGPLARVRRAALAQREASRAALGRALCLTGEHAEALDLLEAAVVARPGDESLLESLLRSEAAVRGAAAALARYEAHRERVRDELGSDPGPALQRLHAELLARDQPVREGLLQDATRLIGREDDVRALSALVGASRVTSILGAGGLGKTRLAHVMGRLADQPVVHFVELAGVTSGDGVAVEVGSALGVRDSVARRPMRDARQRADLHARIVERLGDAPTLLVLDNCEHVVEAVADLVGVLVSRTAQLRVLTTTRAPLGIAAERVYPLPQLTRNDAVELFCERATAARPGVRLDAERVSALVDRLDGLPLAVELAAAKVRVMSVEEIERRLENRFALLRGGRRDAPERHQTLLAVIDWSWNLLAEEERVALRRLSVFRDGFSLEAAEQVVGSGDALSAVAALVDQSLVTVHEGEQPAAGVRYRLLETVREFGRMQLVDAGDDEATEARLRAWAVAFSAAALDAMFTPRQVEELAAVRAEEGNLTDVLRRCLSDGDVSAMVTVMATLSSLWTVQGEHLKVVNVLSPVEELLAAHDGTGQALRPEVQRHLRVVTATLATNMLVFSGAATTATVRRMRDLGPGEDPRVAALVRVVSAVCSHDAAWPQGSPGSQEALEELYDDPSPLTARLARQWASQARENSGDVAGAVTACRDALELCDDRDGPWMRAIVMAQLSGLAIQVGDLAEARRCAEEAIPVMRALGAVEDTLQLMSVLAVADLNSGRVAEAERLLDEVARQDEQQSLFGGMIVVLCGRAELALVRGLPDEGLRLYREAVRAMRERPLPGFDGPSGLAPWVAYPSAGALAAHAWQVEDRHPHDLDETSYAAGARLREDLLGALLTMLDVGSDAFLDYPVAGSLMLAVGAWDLCTAAGGDAPAGTAERAVQLLALADAFAYNRMLPSLSWSRTEAVAERLLPGRLPQAREAYVGRRAVDLRPDASRVVAGA